MISTHSIAFALTATCFAGAAAAQQAPFETTRIADGVYQFRWQSHNGFFVVTPAGVVAVDPISTEAAAQYAREIRRVAPGQALLAVIYSHDHADHATGANVLRRELGAPASPVIAHVNSLARLTAAASPDLPAQDIAFSERLVLEPGGRRIEMHWLGRSHGDDMIVVLVPDVRVAFAVDFVAHDRMGYRDLPGYFFPDFFRSLARVLELDFDTIVFGHGGAGDRASVQRQIGYYDDLRQAVGAAVRAGWTEERAAAEIRLPAYRAWGQYAEWFPLNVRAIHRWLTGG